MERKDKKGFTLVELLIVIGILAILAAIVVVVLNPAQMLAQARDAQRLSDLTSLNAALSLYLVSASSPSLGVDGRCYVYSATLGGIDARCSGSAVAGNEHASATTVGNVSASRAVAGAGWVPVDFSAVAGGSPLPVLPVDPVNNASSTDVGPVGLYYTYIADNTNKTFEINANLESLRYRSGGTDDKESKDGGSSAQLYEVGTDPNLDL